MNDLSYSSYDVINLKEILENQRPEHTQVLSSNSSLSQCRFSELEILEKSFDLRKSKSKTDFHLKKHRVVKKNKSVINLALANNMSAEERNTLEVRPSYVKSENKCQQIMTWSQPHTRNNNLFMKPRPLINLQMPMPKKTTFTVVNLQT